MSKQSVVRILSGETTKDVEDKINKMLGRSPEYKVQSISMSVDEHYVYAAVVFECCEV